MTKDRLCKLSEHLGSSQKILIPFNLESMHLVLLFDVFSVWNSQSESRKCREEERSLGWNSTL